MLRSIISSTFNFDIEGQAADSLRVYQVNGREQLSRPFCFEVVLISESPRIDLMAQVGLKATLRVQGLQQGRVPYVRKIHGRIEHFEQLSVGKRYSQYRATLSPSLFPLAYTRNSRIFREMSTPDIVEKLLLDGHYPQDQFQRYLHGRYEKRDFCVQYQESDLAFISRLLEEEGIFYCFHHDDQKDILLIGDGPYANEKVPHADVLPYRDKPHLYEEVVHDLRAEAHFRPGKTVLRDYRFKHPVLDMEARREAANFSQYQVYYFPGEYVDLSLGQQLARIRLEEIQCERSCIRAESSCPDLLPGHTFTLEGALRDPASQSYLLLSVEHKGVQPEVLGEELPGVTAPRYTNAITCIPSDIPFRPARLTPRPVILGAQSAIVVGPPGEEIHCDEHGRIKVSFHWDRSERPADERSCWIRVSQPWGGSGYGGMFLPRIGQEVLVQFLEGDPDRPVIVGRVYNGENPVPHGLPANKNISTIRTASTPGGGGFNEIRLNDTAGSEEIFVHAQKDENEIVRHNRSRFVGNDERIYVRRFKWDRIGRSRRSRIGRNDTHTVGRDLSLLINRDHTMTVANSSHTVGRTVLIQATDRLKLECNGGYVLINEKGEVHIHGRIVYINCDEEEEKSWVEVKLMNHEGRPAVGERYRLLLASGETIEGVLDDNGTARVDGVSPGACQVSFPDLEDDDWSPHESD